MLASMWRRKEHLHILDGKKNFKIYLLHNLAIPLLGIYSKECKPHAHP
jgi:hypothetical protein